MNTIKTLKPHVSLNVRNVETSIEFYHKLFGIEPAKVRAGYAKFDVQNPPLNLALNESIYHERGALSHLGIQVASTEDVLATKSRWEEVGLKTREEMQTNCCYALQDKTWVRDPDGNEWEVFVVLEDNLTEANSCGCGSKTLEVETEEAVGCCSPITITNESNTSAARCC
ncbi:MAG: ArsI/CadI family heavy metal resistance metalloenzyme [Pyrinomonadaceae bacterium]